MEWIVLLYDVTKYIDSTVKLPFYRKSQDLEVVLCPPGTAGKHTVGVFGKYLARSGNDERLFFCA